MSDEIVKAWESFNGWYWLATEEPEGDRAFGLVLGDFNEWGYFSISEIESLGAKSWEVQPGQVDAQRGRFDVSGGVIEETD